MAVYSSKCDGAGLAHLYVSITENSYTAGANTSNVTVSMWAQADETATGAYSLNKNNPVHMTVNGETGADHYQTMDFRNMAIVQMATWTGDIIHDADGTKTLVVTGSFSIIGPVSVTGGSISCSQKLTDLDRTTPTITVNTSNVGVNSFKITAKANYTCNKWQYSINGGASYVTFSNASATSVDYTLSGLSTNTNYTVIVRAYKSANGLAGTGSASVKTLGYSEISYVTPSVILGNACTITWTPYNSSYRYKLTFKCGSGSVTTDYISPASTASYSHAYTFDLEAWAQYITSDPSATCTVTLTTYSGTTAIGTSTAKSFTLTVPATSASPTATHTVVEAATDLPTAFEGLWVASISKAKITVTAEAKYDASIDSISVTANNVIYAPSVSSPTVTTPKLASETEFSDGMGVFYVHTTVKDSRGYTGGLGNSYRIYQYYTPTVGIDLDISGTTVTCTASGSRARVNGKNTGTLTIKYVNVSDESETGTYTYDIPTSTTSDAWSQALTLTLPNVATETYEFTAEFKDAYRSVTVTKQTGVITISRYAGGKGVALFKEADKEGFEVNGDTNLLGDLNINGISWTSIVDEKTQSIIITADEAVAKAEAAEEYAASAETFAHEAVNKADNAITISNTAVETLEAAMAEIPDIEVVTVLPEDAKQHPDTIYMIIEEIA